MTALPHIDRSIFYLSKMSLKLTNLLFFLFILTLASCKSDNSTQLTSDESISGTPGKDLNAMNAKVYPQSNLKFYKMDMTQLSDPSIENQILACTPDGILCWSTCVSIYFPSVERFSIFKTEYLPGNKCVAFALEYGDGVNTPKMLYYEGLYNAAAPAGSRCVISVAAPAFNGAGAFTEVRVPDGQASASPQGKRLYEIHNFINNDGTFHSSSYLYNFRPPSSWDYMDPSLSPGYITPQLVNGYSCTKRTEIQ